ncbi:MAG: serine hydrolase domain-containing protein [Pseudomonadota bacterium]
MKLALAGALLVALAWFAAPFYVLFAEDNPQLVPFGWRDLPAEAPYAEGPVDSRFASRARRLQALVSEHRQTLGVPALSVAVSQDGELVWAGSVGWADINRRIPATPDTVFRIGSTSKAVTGTVLARLVDRGLVDLDTPISNYTGRLPNDAWHQLTLRQLASHTAGIVGYADNRDLVGLYRASWPRKAHADVREGLDYFDGSTLLFEPGTRFHYSSYDVVLESVVLQEAAGDPFLTLLQREVKTPLGIETPLADNPHPERAHFYMLANGQYRDTFDTNVSHRLAGGGLMARPRDLAMLGAAWLDEAFISGETRRDFWKVQTLADGSPNEQGYALNWRVREDLAEGDGLFNANHGGVGKGAMSWLVVLPEQRIALSMMINTRIYPFSKWISIQDRIVEILLADEATLI